MNVYATSDTYCVSFSSAAMERTVNVVAVPQRFTSLTLEAKAVERARSNVHVSNMVTMIDQVSNKGTTNATAADAVVCVLVVKVKQQIVKQTNKQTKLVATKRRFCMFLV